MKTKNLTLATLLLLVFSAGTFAGEPLRTIPFFGIDGTVFEMPVKSEEAVDSLPFNLSEVLREIEMENTRNSSYGQLDISNLVKPEEDADDVDIDLKSIYKSLMNLPQAKK